MNRELIVSEPSISLWYYPALKIIHHELHRYPGASNLETALERGLNVLQRHGACKWLSDDRQGGALPKSHHEWGQKVWGPRAAAAGWRFWALLPPLEVLGTSNMMRLTEVYGAMGVMVNTFRHVNTAMAWLSSGGATSSP